MTKRMLVDATHDEETRVAVMDGDRLLEFDYESKFRKPLKGSIFLAKVTRVEPSLQAAFVNFGGNRHGFLPFSEIHPDYFRIPIADREALIAEQEAELERQAREEEELDREEAEGTQESDAQADDLDEVDELGGDLAKEEKSKGNAKDSDTDSDDDHDDDDINGNVKESDEDIEDDIGNKDSDNESDDDARGNRGKDNNRGRGGRGRGGRGGRGGRRGHRSRRQERYEDEDEETRFRFNLRRKYKIQEVIKRGQIMLIQVSKEERGNKGAAVSSYLSLPGRYCVLMPNSPRAGGVSRKIANYKDRARMRELMRELEIPKGMSVILRTAGVSRTKTEVKRDLDYLMRLWNSIRESTLESSAPALIYEEANLIKRSVRDLYTRDVDEVLVSGEEGYKTAKDFMKMLIPSHAKRVKEYKEQVPLFNKHKAEVQIAEIGETQVTLPSGGYLIINPTEALVSIDVNSGRATKERHIEETALKTNLEAAVEVARQLRLRDLGGLVVIDFIDMEDRRNNGKVERKMRDALSTDRARIQMGRISMFGLMELSRQRMNPSLTESQFETCGSCNGMGRVRSADATSIMVLRAIEEEGIKDRAAQVIVHVSNAVALFILNKKRKNLSDIESRYGFDVLIRVDESMGPAGFRVEVSKPSSRYDEDSDDDGNQGNDEDEDEKNNRSNRRGRRGGRGRGGRSRNRRDQDDDQNDNTDENAESSKESSEEDEKPKRGRRGTGRRPSKKSDEENVESPKEDKKEESKEEKPKRGRKPASTKKTEKAEDKEDKSKASPKAGKAKEDSKEEKPKSASSKSSKKSKPSNDDAPANAAEHEKVNEAPKEKKKGWWSLNK